MRKLVISAAAMTFSLGAPAQQVLQCANPDVLNSLVFNARPESRLVVKPAMPDVVAGFRAPAPFTLIGSGVRGQNASTIVAYKTTLEAQPAFDRLLAFLADEGWKAEVVPAPLANVAGPPPTAAQLCRNGERRNVQVRAADGVRYATIASVTSTAQRDCDAPFPESGPLGTMARVNAQRASLPQFSFPDSARLVPQTPGGDPSGNTVVSSSARIASPDTAASLARHLARQLVQQGWRDDAEWRGSMGAGSTWSRRGAEGQALLGTLEILEMGEGTYEVGFTMTVSPQAGRM